MNNPVTAAPDEPTLCCDCCGCAAPKLYGAEDSYCLECAYQHEQGTLYGASVVEEMLRGSLEAALIYVSDGDIVEMVYSYLSEPGRAESAESIATVKMRSDNLRGLRVAEGMAA